MMVVRKTQADWRRSRCYDDKPVASCSSDAADGVRIYASDRHQPVAVTN